MRCGGARMQTSGAQPVRLQSCQKAANDDHGCASAHRCSGTFATAFAAAQSCRLVVTTCAWGAQANASSEAATGRDTFRH